MSKTKILTFAVLGAALVELINKSEGDVKKGLEAFKVDFDSLDSLYVLKTDYDGKLLLIDQLEKTLGEEREQSLTVIDGLKEQLEAALEQKAVKENFLTVKVKNVNYRINHGSHPHTAKDLSENPELAAEILKISGQNALTKL
ncbi:hypothetical protein EOD41_10820 [Mucilaginibacter limnophilus]|uniref:Uncharacterized protein n=1 Tax=Mucilaginibacter limnophilus TaxID=1932778 RepID=A0A437MTV6_9SPHI|nr:hypothetical protein [Mucilaginibacter limnophilus]RVU01098.1 hypothetical protein EOD41_10820 [Mucilaginibacter limnophilus]